MWLYAKQLQKQDVNIKPITEGGEHPLCFPITLKPYYYYYYIGDFREGRTVFSFLVLKTTEHPVVWRNFLPSRSDIRPLYWVVKMFREEWESDFICGVVSLGCRPMILVTVSQIIGPWKLGGYWLTSSRFASVLRPLWKANQLDVVWCIRWTAPSTIFRLYFVGAHAWYDRYTPVSVGLLYHAVLSVFSLRSINIQERYLLISF